MLASIFACAFVCCFAAATNRASPVESIGGMLRGMQIPLVSESSQSGSAGEIIRGLNEIPRPQSSLKRALIDPAPAVGAESCDRDYGMPCPLLFHPVGDIIGNGHNYCAPSPEYLGPCTGPFVASALSTTRKAEWSNECQAFWPCVYCQRDFRNCPRTWTRIEGTSRCAPPDDYLGNCEETDFLNHNAAMMDEWSSDCGAFWECASNAGTFDSL
eukprot:TRINITY_DN311_c0_g2_i1.p1 TRINITY_DN311_c0_g2~~TRINITY_DN311_c0_g2_i1.p1  ORF type:complete len:224 (-),score=24.52 TRINITY_DN311_c0_g2_i1:139-780(-)